MSLYEYGERFAALRMNVHDGRVSPHKVCMLLAIIEGVGKDEYPQNRIPFDDELRSRFRKCLEKLGNQQDRDNPHLPFFHLRSEGFWKLEPRPGKRRELDNMNTVSGPGQLTEHVRYAWLDEELFELLQNEYARKYLTAALARNLDAEQRRENLRESDHWDWFECEALVADYFDMLHQELAGREYNKAEHRRVLIQKLDDRSEQSVEYKHRNVSAILINLGYPYISGYKPLWNFQTLLQDIVEYHLLRNREALRDDIDDSLAKKLTAPAPPARWNEVIDDKPPERSDNHHTSWREPRRGRRLDYAEREARQRRLGELGERFALEFERQRLRERNRPDLAEEVQWTSKDVGDGLGYDIRSFVPDEDRELFIEVKTTKSGKYQPFYISQNEVSFADDHVDLYSLYRVYDFDSKPRIFVLRGELKKHVHLLAESYRAVF